LLKDGINKKGLTMALQRWFFQNVTMCRLEVFTFYGKMSENGSDMELSGIFVFNKG
jgi:hypothetical protein